MPQQETPIQEAAAQQQLPAWDRLTPEQQRELLLQIMVLIAEARPMPETLLRPLPLPLLSALTEAVEQMRNEGMLGPKHQAPERLQRLRQLLQQRLPQSRQPSENEVLAQQPLQMQKEVRAQEALGLREAQGRTMVGMQQTLAATNNPAMSLVMGTEQ